MSSNCAGLTVGHLVPTVDKKSLPYQSYASYKLDPRPPSESIRFRVYPTLGVKKGQLHGSAALRTLATETDEFPILHGGGTR